jgi:tetratricopeptide (TPR) repeat protein
MRGDQDAAAKYADQVLAKNPNDPDALEVRGNAALASRRWDDAKAALTRLAEIFQTAGQPHVRLGLVAAAQNKLDDAEKQFRKALEIDPKQTDAVDALAGLQLARKKPDQAEAIIKQSIATNPSSPLYTTLGKFYASQHRLPEAEAAFLKAVQLDPKNTGAMSMLASVYADQKALDKALIQLDSATKAAPKNPGLWTMYGMLNEQAGQTGKARDCYEKALENDPNAVVAANNLAWLLSVDGKDMDRALDLARRARVAMPQNPSVSDTLAWIYYKRSLYDSAAPLLQDAVKAQPNNATYRFHLAAVLNAQGKKEQAKMEMGKALKLNSELRNNQDARKVLSELSM